MLSQEKMGDTVPQKAEFMTVSLHCDKARGCVTATVIPTSLQSHIDHAWLKEELEHAGYDQYFVLKEGVEQTLKWVNSKKEGRINIAEKRDASLEVNISVDEMQAFVSIEPAYGGAPITKDALYMQLKENGVEAGILTDKIDEILSTSSLEQCLIAKGQLPERGKDTQFECLISEMERLAPVVDKETGNVDMYAATNDYSVLDKGTPLMRRIPATEGIPGFTVCGEILDAEPGENLEFDNNIQGTKLSPDDQNLLIADLKGFPTIKPRGVNIEASLTVQNVDLSTGSIEFDGTLVVNNDIVDNMRVKVTGDVLVKGVIQKATVIAAGDVRVNNGIIGGAPKKDDDEMIQHGARIEAGGIITARFIDNAILNSGKSIMVSEYLRHCNTEAHDEILLGESGGKGQIIGGISRATNQISAKVLGSAGDVRTRIEVGIDLKLRDKYNTIINAFEDEKKSLKMINIKLTEYKKLLKLGTPSKKLKESTLEAIEQRKKIQENIAALLVDRDYLEKDLNNNNIEAKVVVNKMAYPMVYVKIRDSEYKITEEINQGTFFNIGRRVKFETK